jgi:hypothetical protein
LIFSNIYSELYHEAVIEPYADQKRVIDLLNTNKRALVFYTTVPGSGKTTTVAGVVARVSREKATKEAKDAGKENPELNMGYIINNSVRARGTVLRCQIDSNACVVSQFVTTNNPETVVSSQETSNEQRRIS